MKRQMELVAVFGHVSITLLSVVVFGTSRISRGGSKVFFDGGLWG